MTPEDNELSKRTVVQTSFVFHSLGKELINQAVANGQQGQVAGMELLAMRYIHAPSDSAQCEHCCGSVCEFIMLIVQTSHREHPGICLVVD